MKYTILTFEVPHKELSEESVFVEYDDGSFESFPVDESNPRYLRFLEETA